MKLTLELINNIISYCCNNKIHPLFLGALRARVNHSVNKVETYVPTSLVFDIRQWILTYKPKNTDKYGEFDVKILALTSKLISDN